MQPIEVEDRASTGARAAVEREVRAAAARAAAAAAGLRRPMRVVVERLGVPAFLETQHDRHVLHLQAASAAAPWLPGLLAREVAHAVLADHGHPSHDPALLQASFAAARERSRDVVFLGLVGALNHHARDLYADDLAARWDAGALATLLEHLARAAAALPPGPHRAVEAAYVAASLLRRARPVPPELAAVLAAEPGARSLADGLGALHPDPEPADLEHQLVKLVQRLPLEAAP